MSDLKPPRLMSDDRVTLCALLQYQRESFIKKVTGVDETDARTAVVKSGTTLQMLEETARHAGHADILRELIDGETGR